MKFIWTDEDVRRGRKFFLRLTDRTTHTIGEHAEQKADRRQFVILMDSLISVQSYTVEELRDFLNQNGSMPNDLYR